MRISDWSSDVCSSDLRQQVVGGVRGVAQGRLLDLVLTPLDRPDLLADGDHGVAEAVELDLALALGRLDHQRAGDREAHGRGVEAEVDQPLGDVRSEEHTSELQSLMRISYAVFFLKKKK